VSELLAPCRQQRIVSKRHFRDRAASQPIFGNEGETQRTSLARVEATGRRAVDDDGAGIGDPALADSAAKSF
jgi:hypothetical protein